MRQIYSPLDGFRSPFGRLMGSTAPFTPAGLFALAEPGVWYDPSDLTTLFQDTAGTTPVTTPGQTVALALDKSKGLVLGSELVDTANTPAPWSPFGTNTVTQITNGVLIQGVNDARYASLPLDAAGGLSANLVVGRTYDLVFTASVSSTTATLTATNAGNFTATITTSPQTFRLRIVPANAFSQISLSAASATLAITITNISVKELPGFHATQATAASRPTYGIVPLGGRRNLLTRTEEFDNAVWVKDGSTVSANSTAAPDVSTTADTVTATAASSVHSVRSAQQTIVSGANNAFSVYVKKNTSRYVWLSLQGVNIAEYATAVFDLDGGTSSATQTAVGSTSGTIVSTSMTSVGSGWYRLTIVASLLETGCFPFIGLATAATGNTFGAYGTISFSAVGTESVDIWGAQLETGSSATAYQRVGSAFDVTEAGVASLSYLFFGGEGPPNDARWLVTPTITPGIDKAQIFAGVRKLSDAAQGMVAELSTIASNPGSINIQAPGVSPAQFRLVSGGSLAGVSAPSVTSGHAAPVSRVMTGLADISGDVSTLRLNGTQVAQDTTDQGTGNYLAYPLYIGRRGGTTLGFNGQIFSLIVRFGTNLDAGTITSTETWVAGKTGVTL